MILVTYVLIGAFLIIEGVNRMGFRFTADEMVKGLLLAIAGVFMVIEYL